MDIGDIIRERLAALCQDLDSLSTDAANDALGPAAAAAQLERTRAAIEVLEGVLEAAGRAPQEPADLGPIRIAAEGVVLGPLRGYSVQEVNEEALGTFVQITLRVLADHESVAALTGQAAARYRLRGTVEAPSPEEDAHVLVREAGRAADLVTITGDRDDGPLRIVLPLAVKRALGRSAGTRFHAFQGQFGSYGIVADPTLESGKFRILYADGTEAGVDGGADR
jgi:hypothetical protein